MSFSSLRSRLILASVLFAFAQVHQIEAQPLAGKTSVSFKIAPPAGWVKGFTATRDEKKKGDDTGIAYLLVDQQENIESAESYYHEVRQITSENGVQNGASISTSFDPSYERLIFHSIRLIRKDVSSDRLDRSRITLLQRETEMERFVYNGSYNARIELEDVRIGDTIEFAYTTVGANPVRNGKFSDFFPTQWGFPVRRCVIRLLYPSRRHLHFLSRNYTIQPTTSSKGGNIEWLLDDLDIPPRSIPDDVPFDYYPRRSVQVTEFRDWAELAQWAIPLFKVNAGISPDLAREVVNLGTISDREQRVVEALRFVQAEIRYLGIESGPHSHRPTDPSEVLRRRFGDCKDKVLLLTTLLQRSGIDATPALVGTGYRSQVKERLPAPEVFDHAIVQVRMDRSSYWIDPTRSGQRGPLRQIYTANYGYALVLRPETKDLTDCKPPPESWPRTKIMTRYRIAAPPGPATLEVTTECHGLAADRMRNSFHENTTEEIEKRYSQFYAQTFPEIVRKEALTYRELPGTNACRVTESYTVPNIWHFEKEERHFRLYLKPLDLKSNIASAPSPQRQDPLMLSYPNSVTEELDVRMFEDWPLESKDKDLTNSFYRFWKKANAQGRELHFEYFYDALVDRVSASDLPAYKAGLEKVGDVLEGYTFTYQTPEQLKSVRQPDGYNWPIALCGGGTLLVGSYFSYRYCQRSKAPGALPRPLPSSEGHRPPPEGIGGWLVLVMLGLLANPILLLSQSIRSFKIAFNLRTWQALTSPGQTTYHPLWAPSLLYELSFNLLSLVFSILLLVLFFKKRAAWRRCFVVYLLVSLAGMLLDTLLAGNIPIASKAALASVGAITITAGRAAVWVPYTLISKRVKATFRY